MKIVRISINIYPGAAPERGFFVYLFVGGVSEICGRILDLGDVRSYLDGRF